VALLLEVSKYTRGEGKKEVPAKIFVLENLSECGHGKTE
jgi:hypothetical protein